MPKRARSNTQEIQNTTKKQKTLYSNDILNIILTYLTPHQVLPFIIKHNIFHANLQYDACRHLLYDFLFQIPNVRIKGIKLYRPIYNHPPTNKDLNVIFNNKTKFHHNFTHFSLYSNKCLDYIFPSCPRLHHLEITSGTTKQIYKLLKSPNLHHLKIANCTINDIKSKPFNIRKLTLIDCKINFIHKCTQLTHVTIINCSDSLTKQILKKCPSLTHLKLIDGNCTIDHPNLKSLCIDGDSYSVIINCPNLSTLKLNNSESTNDLLCTNLQRIIISNSRIENLNFLSKCKKLKKIKITSNSLVRNIDVLSELPNLTTIQIPTQKITNLLRERSRKPWTKVQG